MSRAACAAVGLLFAAAVNASAQNPTDPQEGRLHAEFRLEGEDLKGSCGSLKSIISCGTTLVTDHPFHVSLGSIAPQNGMGFGPALVTHYTPNESWRNQWSSDVVFAPGGAWRAGSYFKAIHTDVDIPTVVPSGTATGPLIRITEYPIYSAYVQGISLPKVLYYGIGDNTSVADKTAYGITETIIGGSATLPFSKIVPPLRLSVVLEANGRIFDIRSGKDEPDVSSKFDESTAPGLTAQPAFAQFGETVRIRPSFVNDRIQLGYSFQYQQYVAPQSDYSFNRWTVDLNHDVPIYHTHGPSLRRETNGPNECFASPTDHKCPSTTRDRWGTASFRLLASKSQVGDTGAVPFYLQRTLGGSDIDGNRALASYDDYRFRGPHLLLLQETLEHAIWGPFGFLLQGEHGKVAAQNQSLDFSGLHNTFTIGTTLRAGGFPYVNASWSTGGPEGHHFILTMDASLLGSGGRPPLQ
jgi:hypothetical protein